ncbi:MAG: hypothetical protein R2766_09590 [Saprospiraceae bacterium]
MNQNKKSLIIKGFCKKSVESKLGNEKFVNNAPPAVVENERKKTGKRSRKDKECEDEIDRLKKEVRKFWVQIKKLELVIEKAVAIALDLEKMYYIQLAATW